VLLSRDAAYDVRSEVTVAPVTRRARGIPVEVPLGPEDGLHYPCAANLDSINTVHMNLLQRRITTLSPAKLQAVDAALRFALGIEG
jgi:mRNA-degrading endonuclease toxin of MazEF toxin-antitoxin module